MNNSCCVSDSSRLHLQRYDIRQGRFAHFGPRWFTFVLFGSLWFKMVLFSLCHISCWKKPRMMVVCVIYDTRLRHIWYLLASYMILACVIYDTCLRHIWYLPASYMMHSHAMLSVGWGPICLLQAPYMPISETIFPGVATLSGSGWFLCYHLGEKQLPSRRMGVAEATLSARGWMLSAW